MDPGRTIFILSSLLITIVIKQALAWHLMQLSMEGDVDPLSAGMTLEIERWLDLRWCSMLLMSSGLFGSVFMWPRRDTRSGTDKKRMHVELPIGSQVYLKISPSRGVIRFGRRGKLSPRYIGPFPVTERVGEVAYRLDLPPHLAAVHPVFHISQLRSKVGERHSPTIDFSEIEVRPDLTYDQPPVSILDRREKVLRNKTVPLVLVRWYKESSEESTWELESDMRARYPALFTSA